MTDELKPCPGCEASQNGVEHDDYACKDTLREAIDAAMAEPQEGDDHS